MTLAYLVTQRRSLREAFGAGPRPALLPLLLAAVNLALFWATASGSINKRPRYLLPLLAAFAMHAGGVAAWGWARSRLSTGRAPARRPRPERRRQPAPAPRERGHRGVLAAGRARPSRTRASAPGTPTSRWRPPSPCSPRSASPSPRAWAPRRPITPTARTSAWPRDGPDAYVLPRGDDPERLRGRPASPGGRLPVRAAALPDLLGLLAPRSPRGGGRLPRRRRSARRWTRSRRVRLAAGATAAIRLS